MKTIYIILKTLFIFFIISCCTVVYAVEKQNPKQVLNHQNTLEKAQIKALNRLKTTKKKTRRWELIGLKIALIVGVWWLAGYLFFLALVVPLLLGTLTTIHLVAIPLIIAGLVLAVITILKIGKPKKSKNTTQ